MSVTASFCSMKERREMETENKEKGPVFLNEACERLNEIS